MYEEPKKISKKKKIELICLIIAAIWGILLLVNYICFINSKGLILSIHKTLEYDDGVVEEWISLGYVYRKYERNAITKEEFVPFWSLREEPEAEPDVPTPYQSKDQDSVNGYVIPENNSHADKVQGILFFYNSDRELVGTYKCINTNTYCEKAKTGYDEYDTVGNNPLNSLKVDYNIDLIYDKYAFIDDSYQQNATYGDSVYQRTIYLYEMGTTESKILAKYADIKESSYDDDKEKAYGENNRFILKSADNGKWGVIYLSEDGNIEEVFPFEYDSISYDADTKYYILCKDGQWVIYDLFNKKEISTPTDKIIFDVWQNTNLTYYYMTGEDASTDKTKTYYFSVYRMDTNYEFLTNVKATVIYPSGKYIMYLDADTNRINFIDYGQEIRYYKQAYFSDMFYDKLSHPSFTIYREEDNGIGLHIYLGKDLKYDYETEYVNTEHWDYN